MPTFPAPPRTLLLLCGLAALAAGCPAPLTVTPTSTAAECSGLWPSAGTPQVDDSYGIPLGHTCRNGTSEGTGNVAVVDSNPEGINVRYNWHSRTAGGTPIADFSSINGFPLLPQPSGFQAILGFIDAPASFATTLEVKDPTGLSLFGTGLGDYGDTERLWTIGADPNGGSVTLYRRVLPTGNHFFTLTHRRFGADGRPRGERVQLDTGEIGDRPTWLVAGVSIESPALAIWERRSRSVARWVAADGTFLTPEFYDEPVTPAPTQQELVPLLDGSLALQRDGVWVARFVPGTTLVTPVPAWLAARPNHKLRLIHGKTGYALLPFGGVAATPCRQTVEVRAPSGTLCADVALYQGPTACTTRDVDVGWEGTLVLQRANETCRGETCSCSHRWWSGLMR